MTNRKTNRAVNIDPWSLDLPSQQQLMQEGLQLYQAALSRQRPLSEGEKRVIAEGEKQVAALRLQALKGQTVTQENNRLHGLAGESFYKVAMQYDEHVQQAAGTFVEQAVTQYMQYDLNSLARQQQQLLEANFKAMTDTTMKSTYVEDEPEVVVVEKVRPPRGFLEWALGGQHEESK
jgi:hypothetical protein